MITMNKRKLIEIEEVKLNLENRKAKKTKKENETPEGWKISSKRRLEKKLTCKEENDLWNSLARHVVLIEKLEQWLKPCWLGSSSLEEQRGLISEEPPMHQLVGSRMRENELDIEKRIEVEQNEKKEVGVAGKDSRKVYQLAGLFQKAGNVDHGLGDDGKGIQAQAMKLRDVGHLEYDANLTTSCEEATKKIIQETEETNREEENIFAMLDKQDKGRKNPAGRNFNEELVDTVSDHEENKRRITHTGCTVKRLRDNLHRIGSEMRLPSTPRRTTLPSKTTSEMHCLARSPGGGKVKKTKPGSPGHRQVSTLRRIFESRKQATSEGYIGLRQQATGLTNLNLGGNQFRTFGTRQKEAICVGQPENVYWTRPRQPGGTQIQPISDWKIQAELGGSSQSPGLCEDQTSERILM